MWKHSLGNSATALVFVYCRILAGGSLVEIAAKLLVSEATTFFLFVAFYNTVNFVLVPGSARFGPDSELTAHGSLGKSLHFFGSRFSYPQNKE